MFRFDSLSGFPDCQSRYRSELLFRPDETIAPHGRPDDTRDLGGSTIRSAGRSCPRRNSTRAAATAKAGKTFGSEDIHRKFASCASPDFMGLDI